MKVDKEYFFRKESINKVMVKMCVPSVLTILVMVIYNLADLFFIGKTNNPTLITAVSISMPVFTILQAFGTLLGAGGCSACAIALGTKEDQKVKNISSFCFYSALCIGILFAIVVLFGKTPIIRLLGASEEAAPYVSTYIRILAIGAPFVLFSSAFANILRSTGAAGKSMLGNAIGTICNIILDPILILGLGMGITGAAIATVIGNIAASIYLVIQIRKKNSVFSIRKKDFTLKKEISWHVLALGWPSAISTILASIASVLFNRTLVRHGDIAVAAMSIASKAGYTISMLQMGITMGIQPVIAYNYGAKDLTRIKSLVKKTATLTVLLGTGLTVLCFLFRTNIVSAFTKNDEIIQLGSFMVLGSLIAGPIIGLYQLSTSFLQATNKPLFASLTAILRQGVLFIPLLYLLSNTVGLNGIIFTQAISDVLSTIVAVFLASRQYKHIKHNLQT